MRTDHNTVIQKPISVLVHGSRSVEYSIEMDSALVYDFLFMDLTELRLRTHAQHLRQNALSLPEVPQAPIYT